MREIDHEAKVKRKGERKRGGKGGGRTGQDRERERRGKRILWEMEEQGARGGGGEWWRWCEGFPSTSVIGARSSSLNYIICERPGCHGQNVLPAERKLFLLPRQAPVNYIISISRFTWINREVSEKSVKWYTHSERSREKVFFCQEKTTLNRTKEQNFRNNRGVIISNIHIEDSLTAKRWTGVSINRGRTMAARCESHDDQWLIGA